MTAHAADTPPVLEVQDLVRHFAVRDKVAGSATGATVRAVDGVSFAMARGETLAIVGESGSGKTTLGRMLVRLLDPSAGRVLFGGQDITALSVRAMRPVRRRIQMVFQDPFSSLDPRMTVESILAEPLQVHGLARGRRRARIEELLATVGLDPAHIRRYPHQFSGGQRQRIGLARALAVEPELIVGDEPVSALDVSVRAQVLNLLVDIRQRLGLSLVMITHDLGVVRHVADRVLVLYLGKVAEIGATADIFARPRHPYTRALVAATPDPFRPQTGRAAAISGEVPSPIDPPPGCRFHTRCPMAQAVCRQEEPPLRPFAPGQLSACHFGEDVPPAAAAEAVIPPYEARLRALRAAPALEGTG